MSRLTQTSSMEQVDLSDGGSAGDSSVEVPDVRARVSGFVHKVGALDEDIKTADTSKLQKYLHRFNLVVGVCLMVLTGFFGIAKSLFSLAISELVVSAYCLFFGFGMVLFEMTTSAKVAKFFRTNYGFLMTFNGRCCFLLFVGFFSLGTSGSGAISGALALIDSLFHLYVSKRNPNMAGFIVAEDQRRLNEDGGFDPAQEEQAGFLSRMMNQAVEDPAVLRARLEATREFAQSNPEVMQAGFAMAAAGSQSGGGKGEFDAEAAMRFVQQNPEAARKFAEQHPDLVAKGVAAAGGGMPQPQPEPEPAGVERFGYTSGGGGRPSYDAEADERGGLLGKSSGGGQAI